MKHGKKTSHKKGSHKGRSRPSRNPKGLASENEHEGLSTMQRLYRLETSVRQIEKKHDDDMEKVRKALEDQSKVNQEVARIIAKHL
jgi:hypothetical protein